MSSILSGSVVPERHGFPLSATLGGVDASLKCSALRYPVSPGGVTLIFIHGVSGHKEQYHTVITRLLSLREVATYDIREIWSIDFPNHGEAATLNRHLLDEYKAHSGKDEGTCTTVDIAAYLHAFLSLPRFRGHNIVGMGHSGGCTVWVRALTMFTSVYPNALILLEPTLMFPFMSPTDPRSIHGAANVRGARAKRDTWSSRAEFRHWLATGGKSIWSRWDPRVLDLYVEHALEEVVSSEGHGSYITPKLRKDEEAAIYTCQAHTIEPSQFAAVCTALNEAGRHGVHIIWAELEEFVSKTAKAEILDAAEHRVKTQRTVAGSGHLVPQLQPDALGDAMHEVLGLIGSGTRALL
ncbi:Alpha/Beta hydrolase protein [Boletus edulis BED1]|uniref:Alpha/Beta hydrolase protein n=1 Tax=Boletus edulis BED1 TaxID=1328754 RepID=A0AAD4C2W9_BOLED|nr:Alpha/Beta hydrolase protein [Boletus edulis BED1]